jgi:hypothetical protein
MYDLLKKPTFMFDKFTVPVEETLREVLLAKILLHIFVISKKIITAVPKLQFLEQFF